MWGVRLGVGRSEIRVLEGDLESGYLVKGLYGEVSGSHFSTYFFPLQGERGVKGACGLDGEKGDKVRRWWACGRLWGLGLRLTLPPDACREKLVPRAALGWQDAREIR